jgi:hypothetical protein
MDSFRNPTLISLFQPEDMPTLGSKRREGTSSTCILMPSNLPHIHTAAPRLIG